MVRSRQGSSIRRLVRAPSVEGRRILAVISAAGVRHLESADLRDLARRGLDAKPAPEARMAHAALGPTCPSLVVVRWLATS